MHLRAIIWGAVVFQHPNRNHSIHMYTCYVHTLYVWCMLYAMFAFFDCMYRIYMQGWALRESDMGAECGPIHM